MGVRGKLVGDGDAALKTAAQFLLVAGAVVMMLPLLWMVLTSLKTFSEVQADPPQWLPASPQWGNYVEALVAFDFLRYLRNSLFVVGMTCVGTFLTCVMSAYAFARLAAPGKGALFVVLLSALMLPPQITIIPVFRLYSAFGWVNTLYPLWVPAWLGANVFGIFLLRQFFVTIPQDYIDAARIDGAAEPVILFRVFVPLSKPAVLTVLVFTFIGSWNDLWTPLVFVHDQNLYTLPVALIAFLSQTVGPQGVEWQLMMAASTIIIAPLVVVFFYAQQYFIEGITMTGLKA